uniref:hypothetical protein n=1 Tax=Bacillus dicomae TaxID=3088378 RepID=UPI0037BEDC2B
MLNLRGKYNEAKVFTNNVDEAPMVYKPMDEIIQNTKETIDIKHIIKPLYNFKAN